MSSTESTQIEPDPIASNIVESQSLSSIITNTNTITSTSFQNRRRCRLFSEDLLREEELSPEHPQASTHHKILCLNCLKVWFCRIGDSHTTNLWRHIEQHHPNLDPRKLKSHIGSDIIEFIQENFHKFLTRWIVLDNQPFTTSENGFF
ncbi:27046_t:CDS:1 [Racocetra persica]|uniref:27046_t:CDS:1 n=1 Tax=Racocetra persica TaxID=160502 RepID=A0ACA9Q563_9GLOM|nr:27046_t:CDS:1 [Racocetra persica]